MLKRDEIENPRSCLSKAADDEPVFVLRASDKLAPYLVELWAGLASIHGCKPEKINEAYSLADKMRDWPNPKLPD